MHFLRTLKITIYTWSFLLLLAGGASAAQAEVITNFSSTYTVQEDGSVLVREVISYNFEETTRHGIFRTLESQHPQPATKQFSDRYIDIAVVNVLQDGQSATYEVTEEGDSVTIKIGDPDAYVTDEHQYTIEYILRGALSYGTEGAEFYYNVTGNGWTVPITQVSAVVGGQTAGMLAEKSHCYMGSLGSGEECSAIVATTTGTAFTANNLGIGEGLTIAHEINQDAVAQLIVERSNIDGVLWAVCFLWTAGLSVWAWRFHVRNKSNRPVIAQYEPYEGFLPMYTGVLFDNALDPHDITAGILYLAEQGFITIKRTEEKVLWIFNTTDYELTQKRPLTEVPTVFLSEIARLLFGTISDVGTVVRLSSLSKQSQENTKLVMELQASLKKDLRANGFLESAYREAFGVVGRVFLVVWLVAVGIVSYLNGSVALSFITPALVTAFATGVIVLVACYDRRSKKGYEARNHLEGFKLFLSVTDKERFAFHNAPAKNPETFMKYLPYAIALKVEKEWAKVFEGITIPNPDWYSGGSMGAFSAAAFTSDMSSFSASFSSSSGTSGSSGGGSSGGGGGGGGGGGSW